MNETRVLVIEDEPGYARFLRETLLEGGAQPHRVTLSSSLEEGALLLARGTFDILLLDLGLPDADGTEALTRIVKLHPQLPIVVLSAMHDLDVALESMRLGAQEYLLKGQAEHALLPRAIHYAIERKRLQEVAMAAHAEAERANRMKDDFLAMLGHELRNPLAPIRAGLSLIARHRAPAIDRALTIVQRQVDQLIRLVDDLLDVARVAHGKLDMNRDPIDVANILSDSIEMARPLIEDRSHTLDVDVPRDEVFVFGDRQRLAQVFSNLLTNAAKYTDPGGKISLRARPTSNNNVEIRVQDNGAGMSADLLGRAFELFEQGARAIDRAGGGLGLGLAIAKSIVHLHEGSIGASSEGVGRGTEVTVCLPRHVVDQQTTAASNRVTDKDEVPTSKGPMRRVLVVDDNVDGAELLEVALKMMGHTTKAAYDGAEAVDAAIAFLPDVALIDLGLPTMDGYEVAKAVKARLGPRAPLLVAVTGYGRPSDLARTRDAGFHHHLIKPVDLTKLGEIVSASERHQT